VDDVFLRRVDQTMNNIKQVHTDCWTTLDDDDWLEPDHLSELVRFWNLCTDRTGAPLQVCGLNHIAHYDDGQKTLSFKGWHVSLFERLHPSEVDWCFKLFPQESIIGDDMWIAWNTHYDKRAFQGKPTYHWDRIGTCHLSHHETNRGETPKERFDIALNYWRIKLEARAGELRPVDLWDS